MGNMSRKSATDIPDENVKTVFDDQPNIIIPDQNDMHPSAEKQIKLRVRHAATDSPAIVQAHQEHTIATLKQHLIQHMSMPFPSEDGLCKIIMVMNKPNLQRDEPLKSDGNKQTNVPEKYIGGSIDHLTLKEYGLDNGDFIMFTVTFPQLFPARENSTK